MRRDHPRRMTCNGWLPSERRLTFSRRCSSISRMALFTSDIQFPSFNRTGHIRLDVLVCFSWATHDLLHMKLVKSCILLPTLKEKASGSGGKPRLLRRLRKHLRIKRVSCGWQHIEQPDTTKPAMNAWNWWNGSSPLLSVWSHCFLR